jgi:hypothetical protein
MNMRMWREICAMLMALMFPAILMAQVPVPKTMIEKIIRIHGTYLPSPHPMPCGEGPVDKGSLERILKIFNRVAGWPNFRSLYPGKWEKDIKSCRVPVSAVQCQSLLEWAGADFEMVSGYPGIMNAVLLGPVMNGVKLTYKDPLIVGCDLALAMDSMTRLFAEKGIDEVCIMSAYRPQSQFSFHSLGLALDVNCLRPAGWSAGVWVKTAFEKYDEAKTCDYTAETKRGAFLLDAVCALWQKKIFNTVLTPNYNEGHANHFHLDVRPGDNRFYLR